MDFFKDILPLYNENYRKSLILEKDTFPPGNALLKKLGLPRLFTVEYSRPIMLECETVNICTNDCIICPYGRMKRKKETMSLELFEKVLRDYSAIGGGYLSLTPKAGDIFCDNLLEQRLELVKSYPAISGLSVTTNAVLADKYDDEELGRILRHFKKIQVSIYGIDSEEYLQMSRKDYYGRMLSNTARILRAADMDTEIIFGFRLLKPHTDADIKGWILENFSREIDFNYTYTYMDWNGALRGEAPLPMNATWRENGANVGNCMISVAAYLILSNGDVSLCSCNNFEGREELVLGNVANMSLMEMLGSKKAADFWALKPPYSSICGQCSSHRPVSDFDKYKYMFDDPLRFIGA